MQFTFGFQIPHAGRGPLPWHTFDTWKCTEFSRLRMVYRPGMRTFLPRIVVASLLIVLLLWGNQALQSLLRTPPPAGQYTEQIAAREREWVDSGLATQEALDEARTRRQAEADAARAEADRKLAPIRYGVQGLAVGLSLLLLLPAASCLWNRFSLETDARGNLILRTRVLWPRETVLPWSAYDGIDYGVEEVVAPDSRGAAASSYWRWSVRLMPKQTQGELIPPVMLHPHRQQEHPGPHPQPPQRVTELIGWLHEHSRLPVTGPRILDRTLISGMVPSHQKIYVETPTVSTRTYHSLDEMPPDVRAKAEEMLQSAQPHSRHEQFVVRDSSGSRKVYHSLDEMPPEVRRMFEQVRKSRET